MKKDLNLKYAYLFPSEPEIGLFGQFIIPCLNEDPNRVVGSIQQLIRTRSRLQGKATAHKIYGKQNHIELYILHITNEKEKLDFYKNVFLKEINIRHKSGRVTKAEAVSNNNCEQTNTPVSSSSHVKLSVLQSFSNNGVSLLNQVSSDPNPEVWKTEFVFNKSS